MLQFRRVIFSGILVAVFLCGQSFANPILPGSSYTSGWEGSLFYEDDYGLDTRIDFAVYDTHNLLTDSGEEEFSSLFGDTDKRYIYAYQILTRANSTGAVASFAIRDSDGLAVNENLIGDIHAFDPTPFEDPTAPPTLSLEPDDILGNGQWNFDGFSLKDMNTSWFLVFASDSAPVMGSYEISSATGITIPGGSTVPVIIVPEPISILLLGSGFLIVRRRRKSVRV